MLRFQVIKIISKSSCYECFLPNKICPYIIWTLEFIYKFLLLFYYTHVSKKPFLNDDLKKKLITISRNKCEM